MDFGLIGKAGLTQVEFAEIVGVSRVTVNMWSRGRVKPSRFVRVKVLKTLSAIRKAVENKSLPADKALSAKARASAIRVALWRTQFRNRANAS